MVEQLHNFTSMMIVKRVGIIYYLSRQNKGKGGAHWQDSILEPTAWASNSGEEKDSVDHSASGHYIKPV